MTSKCLLRGNADVMCWMLCSQYDADCSAGTESCSRYSPDGVQSAIKVSLSLSTDLARIHIRIRMINQSFLSRSLITDRLEADQRYGYSTVQ